MSVPKKYRQIGDFHEYYSGKRKAPYLTLFVGGNHEASNHLWELYYGGWAAPNIYYLGAANVIRCGPLRIAGLSGIWKGYNYHKPHHERLPYNQSDEKSIYHVRELDVRKLLQIRTQVDVGISHDWPRGIEWMGNWKALFAQKDLFEADARAGTLGSSAAKYVMDRLRPPHWFSAHLHCKFAAVVNYDKKSDSTPANPNETSRSETATGEPINLANDSQKNAGIEDEAASNPLSSAYVVAPRNDDEIDLDMEDEEPAKPLPIPTTNDSDQTLNAPQIIDNDSVPDSIRAQLPASFAKPAPRPPKAEIDVPSGITNKVTNFLALDKCLPKRKFLQILSIDPISQIQSSSTPPFKLLYDKEWLAITRVFANDLELGDITSQIPPNKGESHYLPLIAAEEAWVDENIIKSGLMEIPENFEITAPVYDAEVGIGTNEIPKEYTNPQTTAFCKLVGIENKFHASEEERENRLNIGPREDTMWTGHGRGRGSGGRGGDRGGGGRSRGRGRGGRFR